MNAQWLARSLALTLLAAACQQSAETAPSPTVRVRFTPIPTEVPSPTRIPSAAPSATAEPRYDQLPVPAEEQAALTAQLLMVEKAIRDPAFTGAKLVWMGHLQQLVYSKLNDFPEWKDGALGALPAAVQPVVRSTLEAGRQLRMMTGPIPKTLPDWKILEPKAPEKLLAYYREGEAKFGVHWYDLAAVHLVESRMGRIHGLSSAGAQGPMQFIPSTWAAYGLGGDINDDHDAIIGAANYLKANGAPGDMDHALFRYNNDIRYVHAIEAYAEAMRLDADQFRGYYGWQVYYATAFGPELLPVGWTQP